MACTEYMGDVLFCRGRGFVAKEKKNNYSVIVFRPWQAQKRENEKIEVLPRACVWCGDPVDR